jgi:hypothetical protein
MKPSTTYADRQTFGLLLVGEPKTGKTRIMMSFPGIYVQDWDRNLGSVARLEPTRQFFFDDPYIADDGKPISEDMLWEVNINQRLKLALADPQIQTVAIDSLSTLSDALIAHIKRLVRVQEGKTIDQLRIQDYGTLKTLFTRLVTYMRAFNKMIIWTTHQKIDKDEMSGALRYRINMPGSLADNFGGFYSDVWACDSQKSEPPKYYIYTGPTPRHVDLGNSLQLAYKIEVTNLTPSEIWNLIGPRIVKPQVTPNTK